MKLDDDIAADEALRKAMLLKGVKPENLAEQIMNINDSIRADDLLIPVPVADLMEKGVVRQKAKVGLIEGARPLFPPRALSMIFGADNTGKSLMMMAIAAQEMRLGHNVLWIDYEDPEDNTPLIERFLMIGVPVSQARKHLTVFAQKTALRPAHTDQWFTLIREQQITLVVIDSYGELIGRSGLDENRDADIGNINAACLKRLASQGAAVVIIDHTTKVGSLEWSAGSKRKRASINGAAFALSVETDGENHQFTAQESGHTNIFCMKSRLGTYKRGELVGVMEVIPGRYIDPDDEIMIVEEPINIRLVSPALHEGESIDNMVLPPTVDSDDMILDILTAAGQPCTTKYVQSMLDARHVELSQKAIEERMRMLVDASLVVYDRPLGWTTVTQFVSR
jgi:hypothetical protein